MANDIETGKADASEEVHKLRRDLRATEEVACRREKNHCLEAIKAESYNDELGGGASREHRNIDAEKLARVHEETQATKSSPANLQHQTGALAADSERQPTTKRPPGQSEGAC
eukprot:4229790-Pyramimonas_sp.AAC.1